MQTSPLPQADSLRILLVDDYNLVRQGLRMLLGSQAGISVVGEAWSGAQALELTATLQPDIVLLDVELGLDNGLFFLPQLLKVSSAKVIVYTGFCDAQLTHEALALGAKAVAFKGDPTDVLLDCIWRAHAGETVQAEAQSAKIARLSEEEYEVITLLCAGAKPEQVCQQTFMDSCDFDQCLASIQDKLGVSGRAELVVYAFSHGLAQPRCK